MRKDKDCIDVNESATIGECESFSTGGPPTTPAGLRILRVPVTLAERVVNTSIVANINFPEPVLEIKDIKKRVKVVQCRLLTPGIPATSDDLFPAIDLQLFLKGFVRKNIQYATPCPDSSDSCVSSDIRSLTVDIPWECVTTIPASDFVSPFTPPQLPILNTRDEFDFFRTQDLGKGFPEKDQLLSSDLSQFHQVSTQFYNQLPFCELISSRIVEFDEAVDREPLPNHGPFEEGTFTRIVEKIFLQFVVKVMQNQQVRVRAD
ncbi:hypothetical protein PB1_00125 [Bacillus methanolicus PB1]|uniref:DUF7852 domain-containing protein n=1 Tax=Bacillus methanolicus PB1 TaxID=997296 RepID=I3E485_BACMT|nr:hypothetical protein [Bacillus methanolicus]EIJ81306.1 hypothetical protein PB1_00125 [Bacillus methanolicus PB1]